MQQLLIILVFVFGVSSSAYNNAPPINEKIVKKAVKKTFGVEQFSLHQLKQSQKSKHNNLAGVFNKIFSNDNLLGTMYNGRVNSCRIGGCSAEGYEESTIDLDTEYFDYIVMYNLQYQIKYVKIYNYNATYGYEITSKAWLKQFINYNGENALQLNQQIDGISGATISAEAMTNELSNKTLLLKNLIQEKLSELDNK